MVIFMPYRAWHEGGKVNTFCSYQDLFVPSDIENTEGLAHDSAATFGFIEDH
jgi:hypothetical protein